MYSCVNLSDMKDHITGGGKKEKEAYWAVVEMKMSEARKGQKEIMKVKTLWKKARQGHYLIGKFLT